MENVSFIDLLDTKEGRVEKRRFRTVSRFSIWFKQNVAVIILALAILTIILGTLGFYEHFENLRAAEKKESGNTSQNIDLNNNRVRIFYSVLQLFLLTAPISGSEPKILLLAYILAPLVTGYAGFATFAKIFHEQVSHLRIRLSRNHVIIIGLGERGLRLVKDFITNDDKVVVVDVNEKNEYRDTAEMLGAIIVTGNSTEINTLKNANAHFASHIIVTTSDDETNFKTAIQIYNLVLKERGFKLTNSSSKNSVFCKVHLGNAGFLGLIQNHKIFIDTNDYFDLSFFNTNRNASRILFFDYPIETFGNTKSRDEPPIHILIDGLDDTGMGVALQAVKLGHFQNGKKLRLTFVDENPVEKERLLLSKYPQFGLIADYAFFNLNSEFSFSKNIIKLEGNYEYPLSAIIICRSSDGEGLAESLVYSRITKTNDKNDRIPIFVHLKDNLGLTSFSTEDSTSTEEQFIFSFGNIERVSTRELVITEKLDILAEAIHNDWRKSDSDPTWTELPDYLQDANRQQADHILVKLRTIGARVEKSKNMKKHKPFSFSEEEIELLARMEHQRWNTERYLNGWRYGETRDRVNKITPYLVLYDDLDDDIKENDRTSVRNIPKLLGLLDFEIVRENSK